MTRTPSVSAGSLQKAFGLIGVLVLGLGCFALFEIDALGDGVDQTIDQAFPEVVSALRIVENSAQVAASIPAVSLYEDPEQVTAAVSDITWRLTTMREALTKLSDESSALTAQQPQSLFADEQVQLQSRLENLEQATLVRIGAAERVENLAAQVDALAGLVADTGEALSFGTASLARLRLQRIAREVDLDRARLSETLTAAIESTEAAQTLKSEGHVMVGQLFAVLQTRDLQSLPPLENGFQRAQSAFERALPVFFAGDLAIRNPILSQNVHDIARDWAVLGDPETGLFAARAAELRAINRLETLVQENQAAAEAIATKADAIVNELDVAVVALGEKLKQDRRTAFIIIVLLSTGVLVIGFFIAWKSIALLKNREIALAEAATDASAANQAKSLFLASVSHELRTPLNAIIGFSEVMKHETFGPLGNKTYSEYSDDIYRSGHHLLSLINDILDISRIEAGKMELQNALCHPGELVHSVIRFVNERAQDDGITIEIALQSPAAQLYVDERRVKQILVNFLSNAVKFTERGGSITIAAKQEPDGRFCFSVKDTGIGMSKAEIAKALEMFGQADSRLERKFEGIGLGLPLTKRLIEQHGGDFVLRSEPGKGTVAKALFPADRVRPPGKTDQGVQSISAKSEQPTGRPKHTVHDAARRLA
ncbi:MAG: sensor histidine kinase [Rhodospirillaceae bacterium]